MCVYRLFRAQNLPRLLAAAIAVAVTGAALIAVCLHLFAGLSTLTSVIVATVLGMLALGVVLFLLVIVFVGRAMNQMGQPPSGQVQPGNLPTAPAVKGTQAAAVSEPDETLEVWE